MGNLEGLRERGNVPLRDPMTEVTRKERRSLLGVSTIGVVVAATGLIPKDIVALGITFTATEKQALVLVLMLVTAYFVIAFGLYGVTDFLAWQWDYHLARVQVETEIYELTRSRTQRTALERDDPRLFQPPRFAYRGLVGKVAVFRAIFDFGLPPAWAALSLVLLMRMKV